MVRSNMFSVGALVLILACAGCTSTRINKVSERDLSMPVSEVVNTSKDVMNDYGFDIQVINREDGSAYLEGEHVKGQDVEVDITPVSDTASHVKIRVTNRSPRTSADTMLDDIAVSYDSSASPSP